MLGVFGTPATGMIAHQQMLEVISNNLANMNTPGFKANRVQFQDLIYQRLPPTGKLVPVEVLSGEGIGSSPRLKDVLGEGVRLAGTPKSFEIGNILEDGDPLHAAIEGEGFFVVRSGDGSAAYTRDGSFNLDSLGRIVTESGDIVLPETRVPPEAKEVRIDSAGLVFAVLDDGVGGNIEIQVGEIQLARFTNPHGLVSVGQNLFLATEASGAALIGYPGDEGYGAIHSGAIESSNVDMAEQMTTMMIGQRAYALSARALQTVDEMIGLANNLRR